MLKAKHTCATVRRFGSVVCSFAVAVGCAVAPSVVRLYLTRLTATLTARVTARLTAARLTAARLTAARLTAALTAGLTAGSRLAHGWAYG